MLGKPFTALSATVTPTAASVKPDESRFADALAEHAVNVAMAAAPEAPADAGTSCIQLSNRV